MNALDSLIVFSRSSPGTGPFIIQRLGPSQPCDPLPRERLRTNYMRMRYATFQHYVHWNLVYYHYFNFRILTAFLIIDLAIQQKS